MATEALQVLKSDKVGDFQAAVASRLLTLQVAVKILV